MSILNPENSNTSSGGSGGSSGLTPQEQALLNGAQQTSQKNQPNGYAGLDSNSLIAPNQIPNSIAEQVTANYDVNDLTHAPNSAAIAGQLANKADKTDVVGTNTLQDGEVPLYDSATKSLKSSGIKLIADGVGIKSLLLPDNSEIESQSLSVGDVVRIGEAGSFVCFRNQIDGKQYFALDVMIDRLNGTSVPHFMDVGGENTIIVQPVQSTILTGTSISSVFTTTQMQLISGVKLKAASNITNARIRVVDVASNKVLKHYPSKQEWYANTGANWTAGDVDIDLSTNQIQFSAAGIQVRLEIKADNLSLRGSSTQPYLEIKTQNGQYTNLATQPWTVSQINSILTASLALAYVSSDTSKLLTAAIVEPRILAAITEAQATRRQVGVWSATTNTPTLTNPPTTFNGNALQVGDYVEVSGAGTQFGITWAVGDVAKVVQTVSGTLGWYKDPVPNDKFDSKNVFVSQAAGSDANSGSLFRPKATVGAGLSVVAQPGTIRHAAGSYSIGALTVTKTNINLIGEGVNGNNNVEYSGSITANAARLRIKNIYFTNGTADAFTWNDATGSHHLQEVAIASNQLGGGFRATSSSRGFATIANCDFSGSLAANTVTLDDLSSGAATTYLANCSSVRISIGSGHTVYVLSCPGIQITRNAGNVIFLDNINVNGFLTTQTQLNTLLADTNVNTDGYYICDFANPTVGSRNDIILKISVQGIATSIKVHRPYNQALASIAVWTGTAYETYIKRAGGWASTVAPQLTVESLNFQGLVNASEQQSVVGATMARKQANAQLQANTTELTINYDTVDTSMDYLSSLVGVTYSNGRITNTSGSTIVISVYTQNVFAGSSAGVRWCWLQKSDNTRIGQVRGDGNSSQDTTVNISVPNLVMAPNEWFYFASWQNSGTTLTVNGSGSGLGSPNSGRMLITRIR